MDFAIIVLCTSSSCLFVNCRNPSDFGNYVGRLCVSFCVSVCLSVFVCVFVYPVAATAIMTKLGTDVGHGPNETLVVFRESRSKVKVKVTEKPKFLFSQ